MSKLDQVVYIIDTTNLCIEERTYRSLQEHYVGREFRTRIDEVPNKLGPGISYQVFFQFQVDRPWQNFSLCSTLEAAQEIVDELIICQIHGNKHVYTSKKEAEEDLKFFENYIENRERKSKKIGTYWNNNGKHQDLADKLIVVTSVEGPSEKLKLFREAGNVYYDLYNNGLINYHKEFSHIFKGLSQFDLKCIEERMDTIVKDAYEEVFGS